MRGLNRYRMLIYAIVLILMMLFNWAPALVALRNKLWQRIRDRRPAVGKEA